MPWAKKSHPFGVKSEATVGRSALCSREKTKGKANGPIEAVTELLSEELRDLISGLPEHLQGSVPKHWSGDGPANKRSTDPKGTKAEAD